MNIEIENKSDYEEFAKKVAENTFGTPEWRKKRLAADIAQQRNVFTDFCRKLGVSAVRIRENEVTISFYAKVMEQEYGIETTIAYSGSILNISSQVSEAVKLWYIQIVDLVKETGKAKGIL